jgi:hypothetical protein
MLSPVYINLKDFTVKSFPDHSTVAPLLAYEQAIADANSRKASDTLRFSKSDALDIHREGLDLLTSNKFWENVSIVYVIYDTYTSSQLLSIQQFSATTIQILHEMKRPDTKDKRYPSKLWNIEMIETLNFR